MHGDQECSTFAADTDRGAADADLDSLKPHRENFGAKYPRTSPYLRPQHIAVVTAAVVEVDRRHVQ